MGSYLNDTHRTLRGRLYSEAFEFMRAQRFRCLTEGAWFLHTATMGSKRSAGPRLWRFYRLAANHKYLHYVEASVRTPVRAGLEDLPERIDLATVTDVVPHASAKGQRTSASVTGPTSFGPGGGSFALVSGDAVLAELQAPDQHVYAEWLDGLSLLQPNGHIQTQETVCGHK
jgi:engulfment/cell motility protein 1